MTRGKVFPAVVLRPRDSGLSGTEVVSKGLSAMIAGGIVMALLTALLLATEVQAEEKEAAAELELGAMGEWDVQNGGLSFGPSVGIEVTPIKDLLEVELGVAPAFGFGHTEWGTELIFKKPYTLSDSVEFMPGIGPEWVHTISGGKVTDSIASEFVLDFQFWPWPDRKFGWFLEPSYGYDFGRGHEQSLGLTVGLLVPIR